MKKTFSLLFVVFMMVSLVTLVGCNGLWNFDDDDAVVPSAPSKVTLSSSVAMPAGAKGSLRAAPIDSTLGVLTATLYSRTASGTPIASTTVDSSTGDFIIKAAIGVGDYFIQISNVAKTIKLLNYITVTSPTMTSTMPDTGSATTAIGYLIQDADANGRTVSISDFKTNDAAVIALAGTIVTDLGATTKPATYTPTLPTIEVTGLTLNKTTTTITLGGTETLVPTILPAYYSGNKGVTWTVSTNTSVATVNATTGLITAGTATGTVTVTATSLASNTVKASCEVKVIKEVVAVTGVALDNTSANISEGGTLNLVATVAPANATNKAVSWTSSDATVATVDNAGKVTAVKIGTTNITVTTTDGSKTAVCAVTVVAVSKVITLNNTVSGAAISTLRIQLSGAGDMTAFAATTSVKVNGTVVPMTKHVDTDATILVLGPELPAGVSTTSPADDFNTLELSVVLPAGVTVKVSSGGFSNYVAEYTSN